MAQLSTAGPGRKKTTAKRITFCAPQDIVDILEGQNITTYICEAVRLKFQIDTYNIMNK